MAFDFDKDGNFIEPPSGKKSFDFDSDGNYLSGDPKPEQGGLIASAKNAFGSMVKGAGQLAGDLPLIDDDNALKRYGQGVIDENPTAVHSFSDMAEKPWTAVKEAVGNAGGSIAGMLGARAVGQGITALSPLAGPAAPAVALAGQAIAWLGPAAIAALPSYGGIREKQILNDPENNEDWKSKTIAALGAATVGAIETKFGPQNWALAAMTKEGRAALAEKFAETTLAKGIGYGALKGAAIEGGEELAQQPIEQLASYDDPTSPESLRETAFSGAMGAIGGGVLGGAAGGLMYNQASQKTDSAPDPIIPPASILSADTADEAITEFIGENSKPAGLIGAIDAGRQFQDLGLSQPADDLAMQRIQSEREGAAASQARDQRLHDAGQAWQDLGVTNPSDDLQAQRMGLRESQDVSENPDLQQLPASSTGRGDSEPGIGLEAALGRDGDAIGAVERGLPGAVSPGESVAPADRGNADALEPAKTWFGRKGDGYVTEGDAVMALPSRQKIETDLNWRVEPMPSGKFRLAGYADAVVKSGDETPQAQAQQADAEASSVDAGMGMSKGVGDERATGGNVGRESDVSAVDGQQTAVDARGLGADSVPASGPAIQAHPTNAAFDFTRNATGTLTVHGDPAAIRAAGINGVVKFDAGKPTGILVSVNNAPAVSAQLEAARVKNNTENPANIEAAPAQARAEAPEVDGRAPGQAADTVAGSGAVQAVAPILVDSVSSAKNIDALAESNKGRGTSAPLKNGAAEMIHLAERDDGSHAIVALDESGKAIGRLQFEMEPGFQPDVSVNPESRRNGVATAMYDYAERLGATFPADNVVRTPDGNAFRNARASRNQPQGTANAQATEAIEAKPTSPTKAAADPRLTPVSQRAPKPIDPRLIPKSTRAIDPEHIGADNAPLFQGGKPFKSKAEANTARKSQPMMRVIKSGKGFALAPKTEKQLAAQAAAARRLATPRTGKPGVPMAAHEAIATSGGLAPALRAELGIEGNIKIGNRHLFAGEGKGLTLERATELLTQDGFLKEGASHNDAIALIKRILTNPQYTPEGFERMAEAEANTRFEDYIAAQQESAQNDDPFAPDLEHVEIAGYNDADESIRAEVNALMEQAEAEGIDTDTIREEAHEDTKNGTDRDYLEAQRARAKSAISERTGSGVAQADQRQDSEQGRQDAERAGRDDSGEVAGAQSSEGLTAPTREEVLAQQDRAEQAEKDKAQADKDAEAKAKAERIAKEIASRQEASADDFQLGQSAEDALAGQGSIFDAPAEKPASAMTASEHLRAAAEKMDSEKAPAAAQDSAQPAAKEDDAGNVAMYSRSEPSEGYSIIRDPSTEESQAVQSGIEGKTATEAAEFIAKNATEASHRLIAARVAVRLKQLEGVGSKFILHVAHDGDQVPATLIGTGIRAQVIQKPGDPETHIWIQGADMSGKVGTSYETVLHELVHAATQKAIDLGEHAPRGEVGLAVRELDAAWKAILRHIRANIDAGNASDFEKEFDAYRNNSLANRHELVAWALTNKETQKYLESVPYKNLSAWSSFVAAIRRFLGLNASADTALSEVLSVADKLLSIDAGHLLAESIHQGVHMQVNYPGQRGIVNSSRSVITGQSLPQTWQAPDATKLDNFIYSMQDKHVDTKRITQAVRAAIGNIADNINPYLQEELYHGRAAMATKEFLEKEIRPFLTDLQARGIDMSDFEEYLHNRHAERRNVQVAKVNPKMQDGGSGIDTADARAYLAGLPAAKQRAYQALAARVDQINRDTRALLVSSGLEKQSTIDAWQAAYGDEYVPLMREEMDNGMGIGQGFSVRGGSSKRAMGSNKPVANIIANIALQREKAITRSEKQRIGHALYGMVLSAPNDDFWMAIDPALQNVKTPNQIMATQLQLIDLGLNPADAESIAREPTTRYINPQTGLVDERINPALRSADNVLAVRIDGEDKYVFFNAKDERAMRMAKALKNLDADQLGSVMGTVAKMTRWFSAVNTQYNPIFGVTNITRDVQTALLNLESTALKGHKADVMKHILPALRGIYIDLRDHRAGKQPTSAYAQIFEEFQREGGATGYRDMYANAQERADAIKDELADINAGKLKQLGKGVMGWLSDYNESMENAVRVSAYKVGVEQGLTKQQAASLAKNLTVNFNRKGQVALQAGALYAFFNASVQGTARIAETLFEGGKLSAVGKKIITGGLLLGSMQALLLAAAGFDDDEPPDFVRERNLVIPIGDKKYITIPMPLGFHVLPNIARIPTEWAMGGFRSTPKRIGQMVGLFADAFNPIGSAGLSLQTLTPTIIDPLAALSENKDFTGRPIAKKDFDPMHPTAGHTRAKDSATPWAKFISQAVNFATGGTDYKPGLASPTPDQIDYLIGQVTGGVGREVSKAAQVVGGGVSGEDVPLHKIPLVGRFVGTTEGQSAEASRFYNNLRSIGEHKVELDGLRHDRKGAEAAEYFRENREAMLVPMATKMQSDVSKLNKLKRELITKDASPERIKIIDAQITQKMKMLNDRVRSLRAKEPA